MHLSEIKLSHEESIWNYRHRCGSGRRSNRRYWTHEAEHRLYPDRRSRLWRRRFHLQRTDECSRTASHSVPDVALCATTASTGPSQRRTLLLPSFTARATRHGPSASGALLAAANREREYPRTRSTAASTIFTAFSITWRGTRITTTRDIYEMRSWE